MKFLNCSPLTKEVANTVKNNVDTLKFVCNNYLFFLLINYYISKTNSNI